MRGFALPLIPQYFKWLIECSHFAAALAGQYKPDYKALIWVADIPLKSIRENFRSGPGPAYFAIKKANIALIAEYLLYAMPGEDGYGKNDLVFACEGLLPLIPPVDLLDQDETWKLFNELKMQIYIQRLDVAGYEDASQRVAPNLFVESLASYSGHNFPNDVQDRFDAAGKQTQAEVSSSALSDSYPISSSRLCRSWSPTGTSTRSSHLILIRPLFSPPSSSSTPVLTGSTPRSNNTTPAILKRKIALARAANRTITVVRAGSEVWRTHLGSG